MLQCQVIGFGLGLDRPGRGGTLRTHREVDASVAFPPMKQQRRRSWIERYLRASPEERMRMDAARERRQVIAVLLMLLVVAAACYGTFVADRH